MMRQIKAFSFALALIGAGASTAQQPTLYVGGPGGSAQKLFQERIIPAFEATHKVKVTYVPGISSELVAKLQAQRGKQEMNVVIVDDGPMYQAIQYGYCLPLTNAPVYSDVYETARFGGNAIGVGLVATGIAYNKDAFAKKGWKAPVSWQDLTDSKYSQRFTTSSLSGTYGVHTLVMFARANGGSEKNIEAGFDVIGKKLAPNVLSWSSSPAKLAEMFQNRDVDVAIWGSSRVYALKKTGFPIEFVYPKEGAAALVLAACPVVQNSAPEQSQAFVQHLVSPQVQQWLAEEGFGPTNSKTKLEGEIAKNVPYGPDFIKKLVKVDWDVVNQKRAEWTNRWNRTIER
ncbi:putative spermidine/putrescine transport system substrate-binding protein [Polaromonas sp. YR568]|nr:putative spermidine/putrescine transport system substrate-binding protein [Polaromonas sp. YR568]